MAITIDGTNGVTLPDGTAANPATKGTTSPSSAGEFFPAANTIAYATSGSERVRIDSSGNMGIGTSSPGFKLELVSGYNNGINIKDSTGTVYGGMFVESNTFAVRARSNHNLMFATNDTERMKINTSGYVTMPYQVASASYGRTGNTPLNTSGEGNWTIWIPTATPLNRGSNFNTSTGRFTCPVGGVYYVYANFLCRSNCAHNIQVFKNGSGTGFLGRDICTAGEQGTGVAAYVDCSANDILDVRVANGSGGDFYHDYSVIVFALFG
jgi:hypothetical protein